MTENLYVSNRYLAKFSSLLKIVPLLLVTAAASAQPLPGYNVDISSTSTSGISSGGYMALQFAIAHSDIVTGIGIFAAGPYRCAADGVSSGLGTCMQGEPDPLQAVTETQIAADNGRIAALDNISRWRVWLFSGYNDGVVKQSVMNSLYDYVRRYVPTTHIYYQKTLGAGHAMITQVTGMECPHTGAGFINDCDYDGAGLLLQHIYGKLVAPTTDLPAGRILTFDQSAYTQEESHRIGMASEGYLYVPESCARGEQCRVHIAYHGCRQYAGEIDDLFYRQAGYNQWADNNHIIVLYPQTLATHLRPFNPKGCWDWWGYTGPDFAFRNGAQIAAIRSMLDHLAQGYTPVETIPAISPPELVALDATDDSVALVWTPGEATFGYHLYRAAGNSNRFERVTDSPVGGASHVDRGLSPDTTYSYRLGLITNDGAELNSNTTTIITRSPPPACDPYFSDNVTHVSNGRARVWFGLTFAKGSWDYMGLWNLFSETALFKDNDGFQVGVCAKESD